MNKEIKQMFFAYVFLFSSQVTFSMQEVEQVRIFSPNEVVLNLVFPNYLPDHPTVCSAAETSRHYNKLMLATASDRRSKVVSCPESNNFGCFVHKYGSACYYAYHFPKLLEVALGYHELDKKNEQWQSFTGFISSLPHKPKPFFNEEGVLCFYGYGICKMHKSNKYAPDVMAGIWRYSIDGSARYCVIGVKDKIPYPLANFISFPFFLEALFHGREEIGELEEFMLPILIFNLDEVIIPHNYKTRREFNSGDSFAKKSSKNFPEYIKKAIERRYQECVELFRVN